ncbi:hypothetical protein JCM10213_005843 [Rhodosporidiobolus nylandii]
MVAPSRSPPAQPRTPLSIAWHLLSFASLTASFRWLYRPGPMTDFMESSFGGRWQFLTILSLGASWLVFLLSLLYDLYPSAPVARAKQSIAVLAVPVEALVGLLYWTMTIYDPSLLNPQNGAEEFRLPLVVDVSIHGLPALYLLLDFLLFSPPFPARVRPNLLATVATAAYTVWMELCGKKNGRFPYPFLDGLPPLFRSLFYLLQIPIVISLYKGMNALHRAVRGASDEKGEVEARGVKRVDGKEL